MASAQTQVFRFGVFELEPATGELRRNGTLVRLPPQPFQVLLLLLRNSGEVVDRDRIRREVWGDTVVDFGRSLNVCIAQIRTALNDDADSPRFIQTVPKRGYRFLAAFEPEVAPLAAGSKRWSVRAALAAFLFLSVASAAAYWLLRSDDPAIRIAVLPFDYLGPGPSEAQVEGLFDELLTSLAGIQPDRIGVIGRTSVNRFRKHNSLKELAGQLRVSHVVEGSARADNGRLRVSVRLVEVRGETVLWSETLAQENEPEVFEEVFVARASTAVLTKLFPDLQMKVSPARACREGWETYRTGQLLANRGTIRDLTKSLEYFEQLRCAPARAALAESQARLAKAGIRRVESWEKARMAARQALAADSSLASPRVTLGNVAFWLDWDWKTSEQEFQLAMRQNPNDAGVHHDVAWLLMALGRRHEAIAALQRALALDPLSPRINIDAGWLFLQAGRFQEAAAQARRTLELEPEKKEARACLARALLYAGDDSAALAALRWITPEDQMRAVATLPPGDAVRAIFRASIPPKGEADSYQRAWRLAWIGAREESLAELDQALRVRSSMMPLVAVDPAFSNLRDDPRFQKIVQAMGL